MQHQLCSFLSKIASVIIQYSFTHLPSIYRSFAVHLPSLPYASFALALSFQKSPQATSSAVPKGCHVAVNLCAKLRFG
jgi:hypothetical protein